MKINAEIRLRHAAVIEARKAKGWTQKHLSEITGVRQTTISSLELLQFGLPRVQRAILTIAAALELDPDVVMPPDLNDNVVSKINVTRNVTPSRLLEYTDKFNSRMVLPAPDEIMENDVMKEKLEEALEDLTPRERTVLEMRYGLEDGHIYSLEEVGRKFNISRERVRQIERAAIRKLRHPTRSNKLCEFVPGTENWQGQRSIDEAVEDGAEAATGGEAEVGDREQEQVSGQETLHGFSVVGAAEAEARGSSDWDARIIDVDI